MVFFAGALAGCVIGFGAGMVVQRRASGSNVAAGRSFATAIAMLALLVSAIALARSEHGHGPSRETPVAASPDATASSAPATATTRAAAPTGLVAVPNVEHLARTQAVNILQNAGLKVSIEPLPLSNVPAGFVISQNPLPDAMTTAGTTVTLVVSAAA